MDKTDVDVETTRIKRPIADLYELEEKLQKHLKDHRRSLRDLRAEISTHPDYVVYSKLATTIIPKCLHPYITLDSLTDLGWKSTHVDIYERREGGSPKWIETFTVHASTQSETVRVVIEHTGSDKRHRERAHDMYKNFFPWRDKTPATAEAPCYKIVEDEKETKMLLALPSFDLVWEHFTKISKSKLGALVSLIVWARTVRAAHKESSTSNDLCEFVQRWE